MSSKKQLKEKKHPLTVVVVVAAVISTLCYFLSYTNHIFNLPTEQFNFMMKNSFPGYVLFFSVTLGIIFSIEFSFHLQWYLCYKANVISKSTWISFNLLVFSVSLLSPIIGYLFTKNFDFPFMLISYTVIVFIYSSLARLFKVF